MRAEYVRDAAMTGVIFGFLGVTWFGWAQEAPPRRARAWLAAGSVVSLLLAVIAGVVSWRHWGDGSAIDATTGPRFGVVVAIEFAIAGIGAVFLRGKGLVAPWVAFVVGVHFLPLVAIFNYPLLYVASALVALGAIASVFIARSRKLATSFVTGVITGTALVTIGAVSLLMAAG